MSNTVFPTSLDTFINPNASDFENEAPVPHHLQHGKANDSIAALEAKVGINNSSVQGSLDYLIKEADNPGHIHTAAMNITSLGITGSSPQTGAGIWSDGTDIFLTTGNATGNVILRPNGPTNTSHQFLITSGGVVASTNNLGSIVNTIDDGSGNSNIAGNLVIHGNLTVDGSFGALAFPFGTSGEISYSAVNDTPNAGTSTDIARADHRHGREGFGGTASASAPGDAESPGIASTVARSDHVHGREAALVWVSYTPVWTCSTSSPSVGNGTLSGRYLLDNKICFVQIELAVGTGTNGGLGAMQFSLPFTSKNILEQILPTKLFCGQGMNASFLGFSVISVGASICKPFFPLSGGVSNMSNLSNGTSAGPSTAIPFISNSPPIYPISAPGNLVINGSYEIP